MTEKKVNTFCGGKGWLCAAMMIMMLNACDGRRSSIRRLTILWAKGFVVVVMGGGLEADDNSPWKGLATFCEYLFYSQKKVADYENHSLLALTLG